MTTTTERLDRATFQRRWSDDLAAAHGEARDKWVKAAAESAGELRAYADFLHQATVERLTIEAGLSIIPPPEPRHEQRYKLWLYARETGNLDALGVYYDAALDDTRDWAPFVEAPDDASYQDAYEWEPAYPPVIPTKPDLEMGRQIRAALSRPALIRGTYTPDKPAETADEYMEQDDIEGEPWHRRAWAATKRAVLRLDAWAERIGEDKK